MVDKGQGRGAAAGGIVDAQRLVLVTGPSGAGRSTAIHALEDMGFESIDNLPLSLVPRLLDGPARPVPLALACDARGGHRLSVSLQSFSYKRGVPRGLDFMFDCRFLAYPHWEPVLRPLDGRNGAVQHYVTADPRFQPFFDKLRDLILYVLPAQVDEGRAHVTIGFGCTGGQHRSVTLVELMADDLAKKSWQVSKRHREIERRSQAPGPAARADAAGLSGAYLGGAGSTDPA